jgi:hypothetical protein
MPTAKKRKAIRKVVEQQKLLSRPRREDPEGEKRPLRLRRCGHGEGFDRCSTITVGFLCAIHGSEGVQAAILAPATREHAPAKDRRETRAFVWAAIALIVFLFAVSYMTTRHEINQQQNTQEAS